LGAFAASYGNAGLAIRSTVAEAVSTGEGSQVKSFAIIMSPVGLANPLLERMYVINQTRRRFLIIAGLPALLLIAIVAYWSLSEEAQVDACQDQGGRYDYASKFCVDALQAFHN
jgi:hypothetical protein